MRFFFQNQNLQLLIFYMDSEKFLAGLHCFFRFSFVTSPKLITFVSLSKALYVPYAYVSIKSFEYIILPSFELEVIWLISSIKTLCLLLLIKTICFLLLNLCCDCNINFLFSINSLNFFNSAYVSFIFF